MSDRTINEVLAELVEVIERDVIARLARKEHAARSPAPATPAADVRGELPPTPAKWTADEAKRLILSTWRETLTEIDVVPWAAHLRFMFGESFDQLAELYDWQPDEFDKVRELLATPPKTLSDLRRCLPDIPLTFGDCWVHHHSTLTLQRRRSIVGTCWMHYYGIRNITEISQKQIGFRLLCGNDDCVNFMHHAIESTQKWTVHHPPEVWQLCRWYYEICGLTAGETSDRLRETYGKRISPLTIADSWYKLGGGTQYRLQSALDSPETAETRRDIIKTRRLASCPD